MVKDNKARNFRYGKRPPRRKVCTFCVNKVTEIDYLSLVKEVDKGESKGYEKGAERRPRYITEKGKIIPRRMSGVCVKHQRSLAKAIKVARIMALLPFKAD